MIILKLILFVSGRKCPIIFELHSQPDLIQNMKWIRFLFVEVLWEIFYRHRRVKFSAFHLWKIWLRLQHSNAVIFMSLMSLSFSLWIMLHLYISLALTHMHAESDVLMNFRASSTQQCLLCVLLSIWLRLYTIIRCLNFACRNRISPQRLRFYSIKLLRSYSGFLSVVLQRGHVLDQCRSGSAFIGDLVAKMPPKWKI